MPSEPGGNKIVVVHLRTSLHINQPVSFCLFVLNRISNHILVTEDRRRQSHSVSYFSPGKKKGTNKNKEEEGADGRLSKQGCLRLEGRVFVKAAMSWQRPSGTVKFPLSPSALI